MHLKKNSALLCVLIAGMILLKHNFINLGSFGWSNKSISQEVEHFLSNYTYRFELSMLYKAVNNFLVDKEGQLI